MMDIYDCNTSNLMDIHNIWRLSYMTDVHHIWRTLTIYDHHHNLLSNSNSDAYTFLSGPSLASKPLQEHKLIIMMELHHCWLSSTLLFIFQIKIYNCKIDSSHDKWNFWNPVAKFDIDPSLHHALLQIIGEKQKWYVLFVCCCVPLWNKLFSGWTS